VNDVVMVSDRRLIVPCRFINTVVLAASLMDLLDAVTHVLVVTAAAPPRLLPFTESFYSFCCQIEVSKYYLDRCPINCTLQAYMSAPQYVNPPEEPKTIEIGDYVTVTVGNLIGKSGLVL
jgi:hypothetical protein